MIIHFDVDRKLAKYLKGEKSQAFLSSDTIKMIKNKDKITGITIKSQSHLSASVLATFPNLNLIITRTVGVDHIDLDECRRRKIAVYNIPNYGPHNVAQHAIALLLSSTRNIIPANRDTHKGNFSYEKFLGISLQNITLGVIGTGKIGLEVIKIAKVLGMKITAFDIYKNTKTAKDLGFSYISLTQLFQESDVITLHIPSTKETRHIINNETIKLIKNGAILVNTARGELIDEKALIKNIGKFHSVCLDVLENEKDFSQKHPLLKYKNVIITPHCAFYTDESLKIIVSETIKNIRRFEKGDKTNRVI